MESTYFIIKLMQDQSVFLPWITNFYGFHFSIELSGVRSKELDTKSPREGPHIKMREKKNERRIFKNLPVSRFRSGIYFFFFVVASNLKINLWIKVCSLLEGINKNGPIKIHYRRVYHEGGDPLIPSCVTSNDHLIYSLNLDKILLSSRRDLLF